jgi:hypothetical protein
LILIFMNLDDPTRQLWRFPLECGYIGTIVPRKFALRPRMVYLQSHFAHLEIGNRDCMRSFSNFRNFRCDISCKRRKSKGWLAPLPNNLVGSHPRFGIERTYANAPGPDPSHMTIGLRRMGLSQYNEHMPRAPKNQMVRKVLCFWCWLNLDRSEKEVTVRRKPQNLCTISKRLAKTMRNRT